MIGIRGIGDLYCKTEGKRLFVYANGTVASKPGPERLKLVFLATEIMRLRPNDKPVFSTGQSVRPEPGPGRTAVCRPVRSFSKVARQGRIKDEDGRHSVVPSGLFWNLPHTSE